MAKVKKRNVIQMGLIAAYGGKSVSHKSKKDYTRKRKHKGEGYE